MKDRNLRDHHFTSRMAAGNFLQSLGMREESVGRWVGSQATAKIETLKDGRFVVKLRRRPSADRRY